MYLNHFGLKALPFSETTDPARLVPLPSRDAARRRLRYGLEQGRGPALLFGPPGSGKTVLAAALGRELRCPYIHLGYPALPPEDLLAFLADELEGLDRSSEPCSPSPGLHTTLRRLQTKLSVPATQGRPTLLIVDEAHLIDDPATFETLRLLQNFASTGPPDLMLLLVAAPEILLKLPSSLADRLTARYALGPLSETESSTYLLGRLAASGARKPLFDAEQLRALHMMADGLPRRLNRLADLALLVAFAEGLSRPDSRCLQIAAQEASPALPIAA